MKSPGRQDGLALVCALFLMLAAAIVAVSVARMAQASLATAGRDRDRAVARAAAQAALRDGERDVAGAYAGASADAGAGGVAAPGPAPGTRAALFGAAGEGAFPVACGRGDIDRGLCAATDPPAWQVLDPGASDGSAFVPYGAFTGARMAVGGGLLPARLPVYLVERLASAGPGPAQGAWFRITATGFGTRAATRVVLQSLYRKPAPLPPAPSAQPEPPLDPPDPPPDGAGAAAGSTPAGSAPAPPKPAGRIGWREIANWSELHARALR